MKTLILSCKKEGERDLCAASLEEILRGTPCILQTADAGDFFIKNRRRHLPFPVEPLFQEKIREGAQRLYDVIIRESVQKVICTEIYGARMLTEVRKMGKKGLFTAIALSDYYVESDLSETSLSRYYLPSDVLSEKLSRTGIDQNRILVTGIPAAPVYFSLQSPEERQKKYGLPHGRHHVVILLPKKILEEAESFLQTLFLQSGGEIFFTVICGQDRGMRDELRKRFHDIPGLRILGQVRDFPGLLKDADLLVTAPAGIPSREGVLSGVPMVFTDANGPAEAANLQYYVENGAAMTESAEGIAELILSLSDDTERLYSMRESIFRMERKDSASLIRKDFTEFPI